MEGDRDTPLRLLRVVKNRFGAADEIACYEQSDAGILEVPDPSGLFRSHRNTPVAGTCITVTVQGRRPMIAEVQALVSGSHAPNPRRTVSGLDSARVSMLVAITEKLAGIKLQDSDVYAATVGGLRSQDPGLDLAICLAIASAVHNHPIPLDFAAIGEVSLSGDLRRVGLIGQRMTEAARLGYRRLIVPQGTSEQGSLGRIQAELIEVATLHEALSVLRSLAPVAP
jgi:DNA repair protein RadA/Sms